MPFHVRRGGGWQFTRLELFKDLGHRAGRAGVDPHSSGPQDGERLRTDVPRNQVLDPEFSNPFARLDAGALRSIQVHDIVDSRERICLRIHNNEELGVAKTWVRRRKGFRTWRTTTRIPNTRRYRMFGTD